MSAGTRTVSVYLMESRQIKVPENRIGEDFEDGIKRLMRIAPINVLMARNDLLEGFVSEGISDVKSVLAI